VRIIAATHRDLAAMVHDGMFRADLFYRLNVASLSVDPLRKRKEDIAPLARHTLEDLARIYQEPQKALAPGAMNLMHEYDWPGNVRELVNAIEHALVFAAGPQIIPDDLPASLRGAAPTGVFTEDAIMTLDAAQRGLIARALRAADGNQTRAAQMLAIERHRLHRIIRRYNLEHLTRPKIR
jgi:two-component system response regulator HydG